MFATSIGRPNAESSLASGGFSLTLCRCSAPGPSWRLRPRPLL